MTRWKKIGIVACGGALPVNMAIRCSERNDPFHIIFFTGIADEACKKYPYTECSVTEVGKIFRTLRDEGCDAVVMAGLMQRPDFSTLRPDWRGAALLSKLAKAAMKGDGALLAALVDTFEAEGFLVVGADEVLGNVTPANGALGKSQPSSGDLEDLLKAVNVVRALGPYDIGQGAVVSKGQVLAIEAAEGTDAMLARCRQLQSRLSIIPPSGVLVKIPKPGQELRVDLPTIGPETINGAQKAGLCGIGVVAGEALIMEQDKMISMADDAGIFVYGFSAEDLEKELKAR